MSGEAAPDSLIDQAGSIKYWKGIDADVNGMLGGFPSVSRVDLQSSKNFLAKLGIGGKKKAKAPDGGKVDRSVDCGAGIGRITEGLLSSIAHTVDIVEPVAKFSEKLHGRPGVGHIYNVGLENWTPTEEYDLIWTQWCLGYLTDSQLVVYLERCKRGLKEGGFVVVKDNLSEDEDDLFDDLDISVTRTDEKFRALFSKAGFKLVKTELQRGFPKELYPVRIYALQPTDS